MNPIIGGALIGVGSNLIGNIFGASNNKNANDTNLQIAQMNNQWNAMMLQRQMDYNYDMWNRQNAYNDPSQQMHRLRMAGINPYMALGQVSSGQAGSVGGVNPPTAQPVSVQPYQPDFGGIAQAAQSYAANKLQKESIEGSNVLKEQQSEQLRIQNEYEAARLIAALENMRENTNSLKLKNYYQGIINRYAADNFSSDIRYKERQIESIEADIRAKNVDIAFKQLQLDGYPVQYQLTLASLCADILLKKAQENQSWTQAAKDMEVALREQAQAYGIRLNNNILEKTTKSIIEKAQLEADWLPFEKGLNAILGTAREAREWVPTRKPKGRIRKGYNSSGNYYDYSYDLY